MQIWDKHPRMMERIVGVWRKRPPYMFTRMTLLTGGTVFALLAVWNVLTAYNAEQFAIYSLGSMLFFMQHYALTHL